MKRLLSIIWSVIFAWLLAGCAKEPSTTQGVKIWGSRGALPGKFGTPRAIDAQDGFVYVIDRTGRVQKLTTEGEFVLQWQLEKIDNGTPTGITIDADGNIWIPDTHNSIILKYTPEGTLLQTFGTYGTEPGQFIYPTDLAVDRDGVLYIVEYGSHDRVQVFSGQGDFLNLAWGDFGEGEHEFNRPMGIVLGPDNLLYIADSVNHRVKVYSTDGQLSRLFGKRGSGPVEFNFPYDIDCDADGHLYIAEFGNHRIQKVTSAGEYLGEWGVMGTGAGELAEPWGVAVDHDMVYVADTKNHRIQVVPALNFYKKPH